MSEQKLYLHCLPLHSFQSLDIPIFIKKKNSQYLWANDFFIRKSAGYSSVNEIYNKQDYDFAWHEYADELRLNDRLLFENTQNIIVREHIFRHEGTFVDIVSKKSPLFDNTNQIVGLIGISMELPATSKLALSKREYSIVLLMSKGYTDKEIAKKLLISPRTVETHINNAKQKLMVSSRAELIVIFCNSQ